MTLPLHVLPDLAAHARVGAEVELDGDEGHHAVAVRRLRVGEQLLLTDGAGTRARAEVVTLTKRALTARLEEVETLPEPQPRLLVVQALPKGDRGELAVEVLTEIGVAEIVPWAASRSVAVWKGERAEKGLARWRSTAREAAKQARRTWHPTVAPLAGTAEVLERLAPVDAVVVLHEDAVTPLADVAVPEQGTLALVVGPEGGITAEELAAFRAGGAHVVRLGSEVLRTSTAGVAAAAALLARGPRWR
ncbi:16S rRNA (uracil(1498)-N(3))-methyltransferase [Nocardioides sp.]|uniref:16S rRNA (uracil(1498)-N(3))-methyltransferase n=1 Tax=Nocardioides sp. TaxID=35761 RepID=UPI0035157CAF